MKKGIVMEIDGRFLTVLTPGGEFLRARKLDILYQIGQEIEFYPVAQEERRKTSLFTIFQKRIVLSAAAALMLVFMSIIPIYQNNKVHAYMSIDINPSIELGLNKKYQVIELVPYNDDGERIVGEIKGWKKKDADVVAKKIINEVKKQGYMENNDSVIIATVYVEEDKKDHDKQLIEEINEIKEVIQKENLDLTVLEGTQRERNIAKQEGLTTGLYKGNKGKNNKSKSIKIENPKIETPVMPRQEENTDVTVPIKKEEQVNIEENSSSNLPKGQLKKEEETVKNNGQSAIVKPNQVNPPKEDKSNEQAREKEDSNEGKNEQKGNDKNDQKIPDKPGNEVKTNGQQNSDKEKEKPHGNENKSNNKEE